MHAEQTTEPAQPSYQRDQNKQVREVDKNIGHGLLWKLAVTGDD